MVVKGTIFIHKKYVYEDGTTGKKYLILLNSPDKDDPYLFVKTTSQKKQKLRTPGCIEHLSLFFVPAHTAYFPEDTWIQLYSISAFDHEHTVNNPDIKIVASLNVKIADEIIDCLLRAEKDDIPPYQISLLRPPIAVSIRQLKEKWNKH